MSSTMIGCPRDWSRYDRLGNQKSGRNNLNNKCRRAATAALILQVLSGVCCKFPNLAKTRAAFCQHFLHLGHVLGHQEILLILPAAEHRQIAFVDDQVFVADL